MDEMNQFEARLAERLRAYAAPAAGQPEPAAVATAVESRRKRRVGRPWWPMLGRGPRMLVLVGAALLAVGGGALVAGSLRQREGIVPPVPSPSATTPAPAPTPATASCLGIDPELLDRSSEAMAGPRRVGAPSAGAIAVSGIRDNVDVVLLDPRTGSEVRITALQSALSPDALTAQVGWSGLAWSPDGRALAFDVVNVGRFECSGLFVVSADGARLSMPVEPLPRTAFLEPAWAPDGTTVVVRATEYMKLVPLEGPPVLGLGSPQDCAVSLPGYWAPDGSLLASSCIHRDPSQVFGPAPDSTGVAVRPLDGDWKVVSSGGFGRVLGWLPDGSILVLSNLPGSARFSLLAVAPDGSGEPRALAGFESIDGLPVASPDGTRIAVATAGNLDIHDLATGARVTVWSGTGSVAGLVWSPDGMQLAFRLPSDEPWPSVSVWTARVDGSGARLLRTGDFGGPMAWQPVWP